MVNAAAIMDGECNNRQCQQCHGTLPLLLLADAWHTCLQGSSKQNDSVADIVLTGHTDIAEFAEGISNAAPLVASGGRDTNVSCCSANTFTAA